MPEEKSLETMTETMRSRSAPSTLIVPALAGRNVAPRLWRPAIGLAVVAIGAVILLTPARPAEARPMTWSQIAASTAAAGPRHGVTVDAKGRVRSEFWTDGLRDARVTRLGWWDRSGLGGRPPTEETALLEHRSDGRQSFFLSASSDDGATPWRPNSIRVGMRYPVTRREDWRRTGWHAFPLGADALSDLLAKKSVKVLSQRLVGTRREIRLSLVDESLTDRPQTGTIVADEQGRIVEARGFGVFRDATTRYDYPASIPVRVFEPRPQVWPARVLDQVAVQAKIRRGVAKGLARDRGVTLRAAVLDARGALYVVYSGAVPPGSLPRSIKVAGVPCSAPYGLKPWVLGAPGPAIVDGVRLGGMAVTPLRALPARLTISVPMARGHAVFRNVEPTRVVSIYNFSRELGLVGRRKTR